MRIRAARPDEVEFLAAIAWAAKASWGYSAAQLEAWREELVPSTESIRTRPTYVAELNDQLAGFYQLNMNAQSVELEHFWVHPRFMRQGVGRSLIAHATAYLASSGITFLHIDSDPNAEQFYVALGAERIGVRAAPIEGLPARVRPQLRLSTEQSNPSILPSSGQAPASRALTSTYGRPECCPALRPSDGPNCSSSCR